MSYKVLFIGQVWPEPRSSAAGMRILQLIRAFQYREFEVHFATAADPTPRSSNLEEAGITTHKIVLNSSTFQEFITLLAPQIVVYDRYYTEEQFSWRVKEVSRQIVHVLDTEDLHFLRASRDGAMNEKQISDIRNRELASIYRSDLTLIISSFEMEVLVNSLTIPSSLLSYLPFWLENRPPKVNRFENTKDFYFIGNLSHKPNTDAVLALAKLWPEIKSQLRDAELFIYGNYVPQKLVKFHAPQHGFHLAGSFDQPLEQLCEHRLLLAPISFGAGLKGKIFEAMQFGIPFLTTTCGLEGFEISEKSAVLADLQTDFVEKAIALYSDAELWSKISSDLQFDFEKQFVTTEYVDAFFNQLQVIVDDPDLHRRRNPVGEILQQQAFSASKYLSKYIELKNKQV